jgi:hypothetical protein
LSGETQSLDYPTQRRLRTLRRREPSRASKREETDQQAMTTTYDYRDPSYGDEQSVRDELARVFDLCQGCRL